MRILLALVFFALAFPAVAEEWVRAWQEEYQLSNNFYYVDVENIRESGGHKLVWVKDTKIPKAGNTQEEKKEQPVGLYLWEFDCMGQIMPHKIFHYTQGSFSEQP